MWTSFYSNAGLVLATALPTPLSYVPDINDISQWRTENITLTGFNKPSVLVKFTTTNNNGNNLYLDNINLSQAQPIGIKKNDLAFQNIEVYPNPSNGETTLKINLPNTLKGKLIITNTLGQLVYSNSVNLKAGLNYVQLDLTSFSTGIYTVILETEKNILKT